MLADVEIVGPLGRVSLLLMDEVNMSIIRLNVGHEFRKIEHLDVMTEELLGLSHLIQKSTSMAPRLFNDSAIEWVKVLNQLGSSAELDIVEWTSGTGHHSCVHYKR
ncbi:hypothetical protein FRC08_006284 [Ceratobasidium sp. 394]|nr:hypothetical protein FRC08_006284 [Ceratobasidium sp. 394]